MKTTKNYIKHIIAIFLILLTNKIVASPQSPDLLIYNRDTTAVYTLLLEQYFEIINNDDIKGKIFGLNFREGASLNCWRGYQAIYKIENDSLFLEHVTSCDEYYEEDSIDVKESKRRLREIFGSKVIDGKVFIDWYSGSLCLPKGKMLRWDGVFYISFEKETLIEVSTGIIESSSEIINYIDEPDRINRRYRDTISNVLFAEMQKVKWRSVDEFDCSEEYLITLGKEGAISAVRIFNYQTKEEIEKFWSRGELDYCLRTIKESLRELKFDLLKKNGIPVEEEVYIEIWINEDGTTENWTY